MTKEEWINKHQDSLLKAYHDLYVLCIQDFEGDGWEDLRKFEESLIALGILEPDEDMEEEEEEDEDPNGADHWDEWMLDQKIDEYRDLALMGYEY